MLCPAISPASLASYSMDINRFFQAENIKAVTLLLFTVLETLLSPLAHLTFIFIIDLPHCSWETLETCRRLALSWLLKCLGLGKTCGESRDRIISQSAFSGPVLLSQGHSSSAISAPCLTLFYIFASCNFLL